MKINSDCVDMKSLATRELKLKDDCKLTEKERCDSFLLSKILDHTNFGNKEIQTNAQLKNISVAQFIKRNIKTNYEVEE